VTERHGLFVEPQLVVSAPVFATCNVAASAGLADTNTAAESKPTRIRVIEKSIVSIRASLLSSVESSRQMRE
jgi:hypothetical protein